MRVAQDASRRRSLRAARLWALLVGVFSGRHAPCAAEAPAPQGLEACDPALIGMDAAKLTQIPERMRRFADQKQISGAVTLVAQDGRIVHLEAAGLADLETERLIREDTIFGIASMTKPITATAVMILVLLIQRTGFGNSDASDIRGQFQKLAVEALSSGPEQRTMPPAARSRFT
jgi:CubicO group peptidase (beta-lactamase class C family)